MKGSHYLISDNNLGLAYGLLIFKYSCASDVNSEKNFRKKEKDRFVFFLIELHFVAMRDYGYVKPFVSKKPFVLEKLCARMNHFTELELSSPNTEMKSIWQVLQQCGIIILERKKEGEC